MEQNNIGLIIKYLRTKKKMTQEELAYGICSTSQLYRIEKGKHFPNIVILQDISNKLGEDLTKYTMFLNCTNPVYFSSLFNNLENLRLRRHYDEILSLISELEHTHEYSYDINLHSIKQLLGWYRGISISNVTNSDLTVEYYFNLLKLTTNFDTIDELFICILSINDIKIIHSIIATYCRHGNYSLAKNTSLSLINNINEFNNPLEIPLMAEIYYNLSKLLYIEKRL